MNLTISEIIKLLLRSVWERKVLVTILFVITSIVFLMMGLLWPKVYTSSTSILVEQQNILRPLMQGTAETTSAQNRDRAAREVIFSRESMIRILASSVWFDSVPDEKEKDLMREAIKKRTEFINVGTNLMLISYRDSQAKRAYETAKLMADIFVEQSLSAKRNESKNAYDFISSQVAEYQKKLIDVELAISKFRSNNIDATPLAENASKERLLSLNRQIETVDLELNEEQTVLKARKDQLSGESSNINEASFERESQLQSRIAELEGKLSDLRLTYMDNYPDITETKAQINVLKIRVSNEVKARESGIISGNSQLRDGPLAQELRSQISRSKTNVSSYKSRKTQLELLRTNQLKKIEQINLVKAEVAELNRDYDVNQQMYQRLLSQRENAYVSMNIDIKQQGLTIKIQEPASLPVNPKGIRFAHIILAGLAFSFAVPIGAAFGLNLIDGKVRDAKVVMDEFNLPILDSMYSITTPTIRKYSILKISAMSLIVLSMWGLYGHFILLRMAGQI